MGNLRRKNKIAVEFAYHEKKGFVVYHYKYVLGHGDILDGDTIVLPRDTLFHRYRAVKIVEAGAVIRNCVFKVQPKKYHSP